MIQQLASLLLMASMMVLLPPFETMDFSHPIGAGVAAQPIGACDKCDYKIDWSSLIGFAQGTKLFPLIY